MKTLTEEDKESQTHMTHFSTASDNRNLRKSSLLTTIYLIFLISNSFLGISLLINHQLKGLTTFELIFTFTNIFQIYFLSLICLLIFLSTYCTSISLTSIARYSYIHFLLISLFNSFSISIILYEHFYIKVMKEKKYSIYNQPFTFFILFALINSISFLCYFSYNIYQSQKNKLSLNEELIIQATKELNKPTQQSTHRYNDSASNEKENDYNANVEVEYNSSFRNNFQKEFISPKESNRDKSQLTPTNIFNINININNPSNEYISKKHSMISPSKKKSFNGIAYNENDFSETSEEVMRNRRKNRSIIEFEKKKENLIKGFMEDMSPNRSQHLSPIKNKEKRGSIIVEELRKRLTNLTNISDNVIEEEN